MPIDSRFNIKFLVVILFAGTSSVDGSDSLDYLKQLLNHSAKSEASAGTDAAGDGALRVAQRANVRSSRTKRFEAPETAKEVNEKAAERQADLEAKKIESKINRQISTLQGSLEKEEAALETRLKDLNKKRELALTKGDEKQLEKIQAMEASVVKAYERRLERILASAAAQQKAQSATGRQSPRNDATKTRPTSVNTRQQVPKQETRRQPQRPKRRRRLWPFS